MLRPAVFLALLTLPLAAQQPQPIEHPDPVYPPIAIAAHVDGTVILEVRIDPSGKVTAVKSLAGQPMLTGAAIDAVRKWRYPPQQPEETRTEPIYVSVPFVLPNSRKPGDGKIVSEFLPLAESCLKQLTTTTDTSASAAITYAPILKNQLIFHARTLTALHKPALAAMKQAEADNL